MPVAHLILRLAALGAIVAIAWVRKDVEGLSLAVTAVGVVTGVEGAVSTVPSRVIVIV